MASKKPGVCSFEKNFGHCIVEWEIKNFPLALCNPGTRLETQEFSINSYRITCWQVGIQFTPDNDKFQMFLKRLDTTGESYKASWKVTILNAKSENLRLPEHRSHFAQNSLHLVDLLPTLDVIPMISTEKPDELKLEIQIIVFMNTMMIIPTPTDKALRKLVEDMAIVAREGLHSDTTVMINGKGLKAHRAMLYPRSEKLTYNEVHNRKAFKFFFDDAEAVNSIISYLYTGDLMHILDPPSISIYECIVNLDIKELRESYPQQRYTIETIIEAEEFEFSWTISDFNDLEEPQESDVYEAGTMDFSWKLRIYPKGMQEGSEMEKKYVCIEALALKCEGTREAYVDFKSMDKKGKILISRRSYGKIIAGKKIVILFGRLGGTSLLKSTVDNILNLSFSIHVASEKTSTEITSSHPPVAFSLTNFQTYKLLANYLGLLQTNNTFSDVGLVVQNHVVKSHKFLLSGRSIHFSRVLDGRDDYVTLGVNDAERHVFRVFLDFLYTATMTDVSFDMLRNVCDLSIRFDVKSLRDCCEKHLIAQVTPENSLFLLLYAHYRHLALLKTDTLNVIYDCRNQIVNTDGWVAFQIKNPTLFDEVVYFLNNNTRRSRMSLLDEVSMPQQTHDN